MCCQGCLRCHPECRTCNGPGLSFCTECLHLWEDNKCVSNCSVDYFYDAENDVCSPCSPHCHRCTGPTAADCITCRHFKLVYRTSTHGQDSTEVWPWLCCYFSSLTVNPSLERCHTDDLMPNVSVPSLPPSHVDGPQSSGPRGLKNEDRHHFCYFGCSFLQKARMWFSNCWCCW